MYECTWNHDFRSSLDKNSQSEQNIEQVTRIEMDVKPLNLPEKIAFASGSQYICEISSELTTFRLARTDLLIKESRGWIGHSSGEIRCEFTGWNRIFVERWYFGNWCKYIKLHKNRKTWTNFFPQFPVYIKFSVIR